MLAAPAGPAGVVPRAGAAARLGGRRGLFQRRRALRARSGRSPTSTGTSVWAVRPSARGRRRARAAAPGRLRLPVIDNPLQVGHAPRRTSSRSPATTSARSANDATTRSSAGSAAAAYGAGDRDRARRRQPIDRTVSTCRVADEAAVDLPSGGSWLTSFIAPARRRSRRPPRCSAHAGSRHR